MSVLVWNNFEQWREDILCIVTRLWGKKTLTPSKLRGIVPLVGTDKWLTELLGGNNNNPIAEFTREVKKHWRYIRAYHACCTHDTALYYQQGIKAATLRALEMNAVKLFQKYQVQGDILLPLEQMRRFYDISDERVFLSIDKKHLQNYCTHHLLYGSEYILLYGMLLGTQLGCQEDVISHMKQQSGLPTIFACNIPVNNVPSDVISEISTILIAETCRRQKSSHYRPPSRRLGFGIHSTVLPAWILEHTHPEVCMSSLYPPLWIEV